MNKGNMLNSEQAATVKEMIVDSMRKVYTDMGALPGDNFDTASGIIADNIIKNSQMALMQNNVFEKIINKRAGKLLPKNVKSKKNVRK